MGKLRFYVKKWIEAEQIVYIVVWLIIIFLPLLFWDYSDFHERRRIVWGWLRILPFLVIFIIHNTYLLPIILIRNRRTVYVLSTLLLILLVNYIVIYYKPLRDYLEGFFMGQLINNDTIPRFGRDTMRPGHGPGWRHNKRFPDPVFLYYSYNVFSAVLMVAFNASLGFTTRWMKKEQDQKEIDKENMRSRLTALQQQVSPHFFMNTLNNIHALIDYDKENAKESVLRLSELMRYLLYDAGLEKTTLKKEIDFLNSYIDLMRLRLHDNVKLNIQFPDISEDICIPPHMFISFVENAFKYGILPRGESFISAKIELLNDQLHFNCKNSKADQENKTGNSHTGFGISNVRKRLDLVFGDAYSLNLFNREKEFEVDLVFPLVIQ